MPTSFTRHQASRPIRYRTPSPPRSAIEPVSPVASAPLSLGGADLLSQRNSGKFFEALDKPENTMRRTGHKTTGSMEIFADIAISTEPKTQIEADKSRNKRPTNVLDYSFPPSKRSRSEKLPSPEMSRKEVVTATRPATSHMQNPQSRMVEAELLLNFSQAARQAYQFPTVRKSQQVRQVSQAARNSMPVLSALPAFLRQLEEASRITQTLSQCKSDNVKSATQGEGSTKDPVVSPSQFYTSLGLEADIASQRNLNAMETGHLNAPSTTNNEAVGEELRSVVKEDSHSSETILDTATEDLSPRAKSCEQMAFVQKELGNNENRITHGRLGEGLVVDGDTFVTTAITASTRARSSLEEGLRADGSPKPPSQTDFSQSTDMNESELSRSAAFCAACKFQRNSSSVEGENHATSWINCDGCKSWFHFACAGFRNEREVRAVDKFRCKKCKPIHGATTYVRKSSRAHSAIDYAGLHQGVIKTSDERMEHHYIQPIKDGVITFIPENFARMRPELVTAEFFEKSGGMKEPVVIPAALNPRPPKSHTLESMETLHSAPSMESSDAEDPFDGDPENQIVPDEGQDALDMVIPQGLTVRQVAELYGPEEKVEVIDVKSQNGENKKWNMRRWAEYYENPNNKVVRNVISLEVSQSKLGRLIRRPKIVRDLDLQDSVWPEDMLAKGEYPRVQFYCLMSVADCFTDFHIDFGGSSVFYHILKGKKTFLFIPPKEKHLKKYEEWCMSPAQNWTFLADQTKECYRVDLSEGDTMLIPSGWIHAVWTPEDSLVIGGNFLTRLNFGMQLRIAQVEKTTGVARKFRYPHFQKLHWYTAFRYMEDDPLPDDLKDEFHQGQMFPREQPIYYEFDAWGENSQVGKRNYNARYYSQGEIEGLRDLTAYLLRTALIDLGKITEGITAETRNAVRKSIPRSRGEPLEVIKNFAAWCAWKRGNEVLHHWAYPDSKPEDSLPPEKLSTTTMKKLDREAALEAALQAPRRHSVRRKSLQEAISIPAPTSSDTVESLVSEPLILLDQENYPSYSSASVQDTATLSGEANKNRAISSGAGAGSNRKTACEACRKRRRACKHKDQMETQSQGSTFHKTSSSKGLAPAGNLSTGAAHIRPDPDVNGVIVVVPQAIESEGQNDGSHPDSQEIQPQDSRPSCEGVQDQASGFDLVSGNSGLSRPRTKACNECRKSKRRCVHDAFGNEDPIKVAEQAIPRPHARKNHKVTDSQAVLAPLSLSGDQRTLPQELPKMMAPVAQMTAPIAHMIVAPQLLFQQHSDRPDNIQEKDVSTTEPTAMVANAIVDNITTLAQTSADHIHPEPHLTKSQPPEKREGKHDGSAIDVGIAAENALAAATEQPPPSSSLISPPASSNDDIGSSPINVNTTYSPSPPPSKQLLRQTTKDVHQRYTPESGTLRRASSSSFEQQRNEAGLDSVRELSSIAPTQGEGQIPKVVADSESLRLIKELQAQDYGLRRRGKI